MCSRSSCSSSSSPSWVVCFRPCSRRSRRASLLDFFFVDPLYTIITRLEPLHLLALVIYVVVAVLVSIVVDQAARRSRAAARAKAESEVLATIAGGVLSGEDALEALVARLREAFGMASVILSVNGVAVHTATDASRARDDDVESRFPLCDHASLTCAGPSWPRRIGESSARSCRSCRARCSGGELAAEAETMRPVAEADRLRTALLAAVGHDLRRPLAAATAAITALRSHDVSLSPHDEEELLAAAQESLEALADLGDQTPGRQSTAGRCARGESRDRVDRRRRRRSARRAAPVAGGCGADLDPAVPAVVADRVLLQRALVNLLANAVRFSPEGRGARGRDESVRGSRAVAGDRCRSGDSRGAARHCIRALPCPDTDNTVGVGLGSSLSKGFVEAMGGSLEAEDTPGGGLTMVVELGAA